MATITDLFADDPFGSRWIDLSQLAGKESYASGQWSLIGTTNGPYAAHSTQLDGIVQYVKVTIVDIGTLDAGEIVLRSTGVGSGGYYSIISSWEGGVGYIVYGDASGWHADLASFTGLVLADGDTLSATITGTGTGTIIRLWKNTTNNAPAAVDGWDSAGDTADKTISASGGWTHYADAGRYVGLGCQTGTNVYDNFYAGDITAGVADALGWMTDGQSNRPLPHHLDKGVFIGY